MTAPTQTPSKWIRARFHANEDDYRSMVWPPPGPYWCSGYGEDYAIVVAYVRTEDQIYAGWPEASEVDLTRGVDLVFTDRFAKPDWWGLLPPTTA
jgi:hypothetical protein